MVPSDAAHQAQGPSTTQEARGARLPASVGMTVGGIMGTDGRSPCPHKSDIEKGDTFGLSLISVHRFQASLRDAGGVLGGPASELAGYCQRSLRDLMHRCARRFGAAG